MDGRPTWTDCDEAGDYVVPNVLSPRDLVSRPDIMDETVPHTIQQYLIKNKILKLIQARKTLHKLNPLRKLLQIQMKKILLYMLVLILLHNTLESLNQKFVKKKKNAEIV